MGLEIFPALILKSYETGNTSEVLRIVCPPHGRLSIYARGLHGARHRLSGVLQPLHLVELKVQLRDGEDIATLRDASLIKEHHTLTTDLERLSFALILAELTEAACHPGQESATLFEALLAGLSALDPESGIPAPEAAARAVLTLLACGGHAPAFDPEILRPWPPDRPRPRAFWLDPMTGVITATRPIGAIALEPSAVRFVYNELHQGPSELPAEAAENLLLALTRFASHHLDANLRAVAFWQSISRRS